jgi:hypothetical protein
MWMMPSLRVWAQQRKRWVVALRDMATGSLSRTPFHLIEGGFDEAPIDTIAEVS